MKKKTSYTKKFKDSRSQATCKHCKETKLHWSYTEWGWLLFSKKNGKRHDCKKKEINNG